MDHPINEATRIRSDKEMIAQAERVTCGQTCPTVEGKDNERCRVFCGVGALN
jgi:hypothetical protein